jgi:two-component system, NarL family, response regulator DegU
MSLPLFPIAGQATSTPWLSRVRYSETRSQPELPMYVGDVLILGFPTYAWRSVHRSRRLPIVPRTSFGAPIMLARRVLIVDSQPLFRLGIHQALALDTRLRVVAEAGSGHGALQLTARHHPHIVLIDSQLPGLNGMTVAQALRQQHPMTLVLLMAEQIDRSLVQHALASGVTDIVPRFSSDSELTRRIHRALSQAGDQLKSAGEGPRQAPYGGQGSLDPITRLSAREMEVLDCVVQGLSNKEIAHELYLTEQTVKNHMTSIMRKCAVDDRVQALLFAVRSGWVAYSPPSSSSSSRQATT